MPAQQRDKPYIWITWISGLIAGEKQCKWAAWHRTHFFFRKTPSDFDSVGHKIKHTALRDTLLRELEVKDCEILLEQNLKVDGRRATLSGSIDAMAWKEDKGVIFEIKSGRENAADKAQLMIYMWALKMAFKRFAHIKWDGMLIYNEKRVSVPNVEIDPRFACIMQDFITDLIQNEPPRKYPSDRDCKFCNIQDCDERFGGLSLDDQEPGYIPDFL